MIVKIKEQPHNRSDAKAGPHKSHLQAWYNLRFMDVVACSTYENVRMHYMARLNADIISNDIIITITYKHYMIDFLFKAWFVQGFVVVSVFVARSSMTQA